MVTLEEKQEWERARAKGYDSYILSTIVRDGVPEGILAALFTLLFGYFGHGSAKSQWEILMELGFLILALGWMRGAMSWRENESKYVKAEDLDQNEIDHSASGTKQSNVVH